MTPIPGRPLRRYSRLWTVIFGGLLVLTFFKAWAPHEPVLAVAQAQVSNPTAQRRQQLIEARRTNALLSDIKQILESGKLHVLVDAADNQPGLGTPVRRHGQ